MFISLKNNKMTVKELMALCNKQILLWNGDKTVFISQDDEWNDYHELMFWFTSKSYEIKWILEKYRIEDMQVHWIKLDNIVLLW